MRHTIKNIAVIGSGTMGSGIAAHAANAGLNVLLLDIIVEGESRNYLAEKALQKMIEKSAYFFTKPSNAQRITVGNLEDDLTKLSRVGWIIEVITENLSLKHALYNKIKIYCGDKTILSSNTSTFTLESLSANMSLSLKSRFFITHFFNPPRYVPLLEFVSPKNSLYRDWLANFCAHNLGRLVINCNDTPGFIANRIGCAWLAICCHEAEKYGISLARMDEAIRKVMRVPKTGAFGLLDLIGIDIFVSIMNTLHDSLPSSDSLFNMIDTSHLISEMLNNKWLGNKNKVGFYKADAEGKKYVLDTRSMQHVEIVKEEIGTLQEIMRGQDDFCIAIRNAVAKSLLYAYYTLPEVATNVFTVDSAMCGGYNWSEGPFRLIDSITQELGRGWLSAEAERLGLPKPIDSDFYVDRKCISANKNYVTINEDFIKYDINYLCSSSAVIMSNNSATFLNIGDNISCFVINNKNRVIDIDVLILLEQALHYSVSNGMYGMVITGGDNFCLGANIRIFVEKVERGHFSDIAEIINLGTNVFNKLHNASIPIVAAVSGLVLGGGCELMMSCSRVVAHSNARIGLVEANIGLIPGWGGIKEITYRVSRSDIAKIIDQILQGKISSSAEEAVDMLYLDSKDKIIMNQLDLISEAKNLALEMYGQGYKSNHRVVFNNGIKTYADILEEYVAKKNYTVPVEKIAKGIVGLYRHMDRFDEEQTNLFIDLVKTAYAMDKMRSTFKN